MLLLFPTNIFLIKKVINTSAVTVWKRQEVSTDREETHSRHAAELQQSKREVTRWTLQTDGMQNKTWDWP